MPERLLRGIQNIASHWKKWLECSLENVPPQLKQLKTTQAERFTKTLKRYVAFLHLAQVAHPALSECALHSLSKELNEISENNMTTDWVLQTKDPIKYLFPTAEADVKVVQGLKKLLECECAIEMLIGMLDDLVKKVFENKNAAEKARCSILCWTYTLSKISYWLTEKKSENFITFHLFSSLLQEYLLLAFENREAQEQEDALDLNFKKHLRTPASNTTSYLKPATSCFLVSSKKVNYRHKVKEKTSNSNSSTSKKIKTEQKSKDRTLVTFSREPERSWKINFPVPELSSTNFMRNKECYSDCRFQQSTVGFHSEGYITNDVMTKFPHIYTYAPLPTTETQASVHYANEISPFSESWLTKDVDLIHPALSQDTLQI
ncbi:DNA-binding protein RFX6 [Trichonephila clavata]|uniref:DNA-binding protein RFX6 n=1 Tax=Trichonephila clavata TaxID=2740835 RepID=A0A8X6H6E0_TRICU|nr:DNA-binding protein RFX6 [Trichonephila clavata]